MWAIFQVFIECYNIASVLCFVFLLLLLFLTERHVGSHLLDHGMNP